VATPLHPNLKDTTIAPPLSPPLFNLKKQVAHVPLPGHFTKIVEAAELDLASKAIKTRPPHGRMGGPRPIKFGIAEPEIPMDQRKRPLEFLAGSSSSSDNDDNKQPWNDNKDDSDNDDGDYVDNGV
jgi:hypothetical protein